MATKYIDIHQFIDALAQEPGDILVSTPTGECQGYSANQIRRILWSLPEADVGCASIKRGHINICNDPNKTLLHFECSECGTQIIGKVDTCPRCGVLFDGRAQIIPPRGGAGDE